MTKKEWSNIWIGDRVTTQTYDIKNGEMVRVTLVGRVTRLNSNRSQVLVQWDFREGESWYGRLGLEIAK